MATPSSFTFPQRYVWPKECTSITGPEKRYWFGKFATSYNIVHISQKLGTG